MKAITLSHFWAGKSAYFAKGSDGWQYAVGHDRYNAPWLGSLLKRACETQVPQEIRYLEGERVRWVRDITPAQPVDHQETA